jgi:hypothetical protein
MVKVSIQVEKGHLRVAEGHLLARLEKARERKAELIKTRSALMRRAIASGSTLLDLQGARLQKVSTSACCGPSPPTPPATVTSCTPTPLHDLTRYPTARPLSSFKTSATISARDVHETHLPPVTEGSSPLDDFKTAVSRYKLSVACSRGVRVPDVAWFVLAPYEVSPGVPLSFSEGLSSAECISSAQTRCFAMSLESALLRAQLRNVESQGTFSNFGYQGRALPCRVRKEQLADLNCWARLY